MTTKGRLIAAVALLSMPIGCGDNGGENSENNNSGGTGGTGGSSSDSASDSGGSSSTADSGGTSSTSTGSGDTSSSTGGTSNQCEPSSDSESECSDGFDNDCDGVVDCLDSDCEGVACGGREGLSCLAGGCLGQGSLPELPVLDNVNVQIINDMALINFTAFNGAKDYRVYESPNDDDILVGEDGEFAVRNAIYRCSGDTPRNPRNDDQVNAVTGVFDRSIVGNIHGYDRTEAESLLGYVYLTPGEGREPIYRVADPNRMGGYAWEYAAPPAKEFNAALYVGTEERDELLQNGWRDDGVAFYVPEDASKPVYYREYDDGSHVLFYTAGPERDARGDGTEMLRVLDSEASGSVPLYRIFYGHNNEHDNLAAGEANRERVLYQGNLPLTSLVWSGLEGTTTLVIEALDNGCPFPGGYIGASSAPATGLGDFPNEPTITLDEARLSSGEVFINGQHDPNNRPKPIARAYVVAEPEPEPDMDWYATFNDDEGFDSFETLVDDNNGTRVFRNDKFSFEFFFSDENYSYGPVMGQLVMGSVSPMYLVPMNADAHLTADSYLHVTMAADVPASFRRYPSIWITTTPLGQPGEVPDGSLPIATRTGPVPFDNAGPGESSTLVIQPFGIHEELQLQFCDQRGWGVSAQCPRANLYGYHAGTDQVTWEEPWLPNPVLGEKTGTDRLVNFEVYASTQRVYLFIDRQPAGCAQLPEGRMPDGPVNIVFGNAAYHIDIDFEVVEDNSAHQYWYRYSKSYAQRRFDNLGVNSEVGAPEWDEGTLPCGTIFYE